MCHTMKTKLIDERKEFQANGMYQIFKEIIGEKFLKIKRYTQSHKKHTEHEIDKTRNEKPYSISYLKYKINTNKKVC